MRRRVLVLSASMGAGHDGAAREFVRRLQAQGHDTRMHDVLEAAPLGIGRFVRSGYEQELRRMPWMYEFTYRLCEVVALLTIPVGWLVNLLATRGIRRWIDDFNPDVVVSTYPLASVVLGRLRRRGTLTVPAVTFVTDFAVHPLWTTRGIDLHLAVHATSAMRAAEQAHGPARALGPLVPDRFTTERPSKADARRVLGIERDERVALVVAGSWGVGDVERTFHALGAAGYVPLTVCGNNDDLRRSLEAFGTGHIVGWTDDMPTMMAAADVLVQNAGGLTCMEAFAAGVPVVTYRPIPGHGRENALDMERAGVAAFARTTAELKPALDNAAFGVGGRRMVAAGRALFAGDPVDEVLELAAARETVPVLHPIRRANARQRVAAGVAALVTMYASLTIGVSTATAHGIGVAHGNRHRDTVYVGVRLGPSVADSEALPAVLSHEHMSGIVDATLVSKHADWVQSLGAAGVDLANGGWGGKHRFQWRRARADTVRAKHTISLAGHDCCRMFVPQRRLSAFDLASARQAHERAVVPRHVLSPDADLPTPKRGEVYVVDARGHDADTVLNYLFRLDQQLQTSGMTVAPLSRLR